MTGNIEKFQEQITQVYRESRGDSSRLFDRLQEVAQEIGMEQVLACLETAVTEKRLAWWEANGQSFVPAGDPLMDAFRLFYEVYLGLKLEQNGQIVEQTSDRLVTRWWNPCPTLEACCQFGLDTRLVCRLAYEKPVERLISQLDPRLRFTRHYSALRPYAPYCEEVITLADLPLDRLLT